MTCSEESRGNPASETDIIPTRAPQSASQQGVHHVETYLRPFAKRDAIPLLARFANFVRCMRDPAGNASAICPARHRAPRVGRSLFGQAGHGSLPVARRRGG